MSGTFNSQDKDWIRSSLRLGNFTDIDFVSMESAFDEQTDYDIATIKKSMQHEKFLRKVCLYKMIMFPIEWLTIRIILGKIKAKEHVKLTKLYRAFFKKKIDLSTFQKSLQGVVKHE